jgi:hypothetical protein
MAVLVSSDLERPAILGPGRQEQLRLDAAPAQAPAPASPAPRPVRAPRGPDPGRAPSARPERAVRETRPSGELTLDELLVVAWEGVTAHHQASCPVCRGAMVPRYAAAGPESLGGRCRDCGSTLA